MNLKKHLFFILFVLITTIPSLSQTPTPPNGKKWEKIESMSDEFNGTSLNTSKWAINSPQWEGRRPARFETSSVSVSGGNLKITASKKTNPSNGWTHNGGLIRSKTKNLYGYYEARIKANKTFMSSTFWLINKRNEFTGCDYRVTELDVTENVGRNTGGQSWIDRNIVTLNANTHSRGTSCNSTPVGIRGNKADIGEPAYAGYHTYGVWWKNAKECLFYLDGRFVFKINPAADFSLAMYLRMVVETYDWNPPKAGQDGMNDSAANRTTYYDWVRSYKLVDDNGGGDPDPNPTNETVSFNNAPTAITPQTAYTFNVDYEASADREIVVEFWSPTAWIAQQKKTVAKGKGTTSITVTLPSAPTLGSGYVYKVHVRPVGTTWREAIDRDQVNNVIVENEVVIEDKIAFKNAPTSINPANSYTFTMEYSASLDREIAVSFWKNNTWVASKVEQVSKGSGIKAITVNLPSSPTPGNGYAYKSHIRPIGTNWQQALDTDQVNNVTVITNNPQLIANGTYFITATQNTQRLLSRNLENHSARMHNPGSYNDQKWIFKHLGDNIYTIKNMGTQRFLEVPYALCNNGANVATWTNSSNNHKKWKVITNGNEVFGLKPMHCPDLGLDRASGAIDANVQLWDYSSANNNQKWKIIPAASNRSFDKNENIVGLYPNPARDIVTVTGHDLGEKIVIYNLLGKTIKSVETKSNEELISITNLEAGIYIISIGNKTKLQLIKE
ncbi:family 16 glycosylhydrolase [Aquimarina sp. MMG016]|uniref:family 16 glycosylhydrolase n=1 Tax=Aquimarina sp. MMG016 TaxID=2822690 RepID=UPI001B39EEBD|nr:family 16 glycosylhydrolase [Aquimarina sp. MMG016]MBQ4819028.1 family 16 glycosylhydrolase [Aquimarina sp. MMG016]